MWEALKVYQQNVIQARMLYNVITDNVITECYTSELLKCIPEIWAIFPGCDKTTEMYMTARSFMFLQNGGKNT